MFLKISKFYGNTKKIIKFAKPSGISIILALLITQDWWQLNTIGEYPMIQALVLLVLYRWRFNVDRNVKNHMVYNNCNRKFKN